MKSRILFLKKTYKTVLSILLQARFHMKTLWNRLVIKL